MICYYLNDLQYSHSKQSKCDFVGLENQRNVRLDLTLCLLKTSTHFPRFLVLKLLYTGLKNPVVHNITYH
jgi:hypothetical protein